MCLRILMHVNTAKAQDEMQFVYLSGARALRPDLVRIARRVSPKRRRQAHRRGGNDAGAAELEEETEDDGDHEAGAYPRRVRRGHAAASRKSGLDGHPIVGVERTVIGVVGLDRLHPELADDIEVMPGVESTVPISSPYKLCSREFKRDGHDRRRQRRAASAKAR